MEELAIVISSENIHERANANAVLESAWNEPDVMWACPNEASNG